MCDNSPNGDHAKYGTNNTDCSKNCHSTKLVAWRFIYVVFFALRLMQSLLVCLCRKTTQTARPQTAVQHMRKPTQEPTTHRTLE